MSFYIYDSAGRIVSIKSGAEPLPPEVPVGGGYGEGEASQIQEWVNAGIKEARPEMSLAFNQNISVGEDFTVTGMLPDTIVTHPDGMGHPTQTNTGQETELQWSTAEPGTYQFIFENFPYQKVIIDVSVTSN